jgi:hypothetical protein
MAGGEMAKALKEAHQEVEDEEDEHLYHTTIGAARAKQARGRMKKAS